MRHWLIVFLVTLLVSSLATAQEHVFRFANSADVLTMDPHGALVVQTQMVQGFVYEGLTRINQRLGFEPALAESYARIAPDVWRFKLRGNVRFHDGSQLTADDVVFSVRRAISQKSAIRGIISTISDARKIDDATVDIATSRPNPILDRDLPLLYIISKPWAEAHGATEPIDFRFGADNFAVNHANGTGPFVLKERIAGERTVLMRNPGWWDVAPGNVTEAVFRPIRSAPTRMAALLSGTIDMMEPVPVQDIEHLARTPGFKVLRGPQARVIYIGLDQMHDELPEASVKGRNPFRDVRVRRALYEAIDVETIRHSVLHDNSTPTAVPFWPGAQGYTAALDERLSFDPAAARRLLAEAGYPDGFEVGMDCANDRDVSPEEICQAIAGMLAQIGVKVSVAVRPTSQFLAKVLGHKSSLYVSGWLDATFDALNPLSGLIATPKNGRGPLNGGGYSNPELDALIDRIEVEDDPAKRQQAVDQAVRLYRDDVAQIPLHHQWLAWGMKATVELVQTPDDIMRLQWVTVK